MAALVGVALPLLTAAAAEPAFELIDVFKSRTGGYYHMRIPGIVVTPHGTVIAYAEGRKQSGDWSEIDIIARRSTDGGRTWGATQLLADSEAYDGPRNLVVRSRRDPAGAPSDSVTCNNPVMIVDRKKPIVHFLYNVEYGRRSFYRRSTDDGATFGEPVDITATLAKFQGEYDWHVTAFGPGHGIHLESGRLLVPVWISPGGGTNGHQPSCVATLYSDDHGTTWQRGEIVVVDAIDAYPGRAGVRIPHTGTALKNKPRLAKPSETVAVQLADGRVMLNMRNQSEQHRRAVAFSPDGISQWTGPRLSEELYEPICMGSIIRIPARFTDGREWLLFSNPDPMGRNGVHGSRERINVTLKVSYDQGETWPLRKVLDPGNSGYSDLAVGPDGTVYCLYERGSEQRTAFDPVALSCARFNVEWLRAD